MSSAATERERLLMLRDELRAIAAGEKTTLNPGEADAFAASIDVVLEAESNV